MKKILSLLTSGMMLFLPLSVQGASYSNVTIDLSSDKLDRLLDDPSVALVRIADAEDPFVLYEMFKSADIDLSSLKTNEEKIKAAARVETIILEDFDASEATNWEEYINSIEDDQIVFYTDSIYDKDSLIFPEVDNGTYLLFLMGDEDYLPEYNIFELEPETGDSASYGTLAPTILFLTGDPINVDIDPKIDESGDLDDLKHGEENVEKPGNDNEPGDKDPGSEEEGSKPSKPSEEDPEEDKKNPAVNPGDDEPGSSNGTTNNPSNNPGTNGTVSGTTNSTGNPPSASAGTSSSLSTSTVTNSSVNTASEFRMDLYLTMAAVAAGVLGILLISYVINKKKAKKF